MAKLAIMNNVTRTFNKVGFKFKKHSPEILVAAGVVGVIGSTVIACKATTKATELIKQAKEDVEAIKKCAEVNKEEYTEEDVKKAVGLTYTKAGLNVAKLYAPAVALGALSITAIVSSHNILRKRNIALAAAYATVDKSFKEYSGRVIERFGEELDKELRYGLKTKEIEETVVDEKGNEKIVKKSVQVVEDTNLYSPYSIVFDNGNIGWDDDPEITKFFLVQQQNYANDKLKAQGHLFLNEVHDMLGAPRTKYGNCVGWIYDEKNPVGDNFVDFGIFDVHKPKACDFVNGYEKAIILDFNVDGNILDLI